MVAELGSAVNPGKAPWMRELENLASTTPNSANAIDMLGKLIVITKNLSESLVTTFGESDAMFKAADALGKYAAQGHSMAKAANENATVANNGTKTTLEQMNALASTVNSMSERSSEFND